MTIVVGKNSDHRFRAMATATVSAAANSEFAPRAPSANSVAADVGEEDARPLISINWADMHITAKLVTNSAPPGGVNMFTERSVAPTDKNVSNARSARVIPCAGLTVYLYSLVQVSSLPKVGRSAAAQGNR